MTRLNIIVEGPTEETFVNKILAPYLAHKGVYACAYSVNGGFTYKNWRKDILCWIKQDKDQDLYFTTMFDFYGLENLSKNTPFPGLQESENEADPYRHVGIIEKAFKDDINHHRFIPYIQLHEFEALLFSSPEILGKIVPSKDVANEIKAIADEFETPEKINNSTQTAPSKRILKLLDTYQKVLHGVLAAQQIGLETIRQKCPHFNDWVAELENLPNKKSVTVE